MTVALRARRGALALLMIPVLVACGGEDDSPVVSAAPATTATTAAGSTVTTATGGPSTTGAQGTVVAITVRGGSVEGPSRQRVTLNERVTLRVTSDVADEVHVHVYDRRADVAPNSPAELSFVANVPGVFEVELENSHRRLTTLEVQP